MDTGIVLRVNILKNLWNLCGMCGQKEKSNDPVLVQQFGMYSSLILVMGLFTEWRWTGCCPDSRSACSPVMSWNTSPHQCWCHRRRRHRRRAARWAAGQRCSYAWTTQNVRTDADCVFLSSLASYSAAVVYLISFRRVLSWLCSCSLASSCSSRSLCSFFLLCSSRSISSSASSICRFKAFRRRFNYKENQQARGYTRFNKHQVLGFMASLYMSVWWHTWSLWSCMEWCSSSPCIIISFTFLSRRRFASCRLARSLKSAERCIIIHVAQHRPIG